MFKALLRVAQHVHNMQLAAGEAELTSAIVLCEFETWISLD